MALMEPNRLLTELIVIRHGETAWNADNRIQGHADIALNRTGLLQAQAIARRLAAVPIDVIFSSDLLRARQTAHAIAQVKALKIHLDARLREVNLGVFQGMTRMEAQQKFTGDYNRFFHSPEYAFAIDGGESRADKEAQIAGFIEDTLLVFRGKRIVLVTHGGPLLSVFRVTLGIPQHMPVRLKLYNAGINRFLLEDDSWILSAWGDISHLQNLVTMAEL
jgi:2,3-bisphosphoglycerate-dependent phosphoglycerate mutase